MENTSWINIREKDKNEFSLWAKKEILKLSKTRGEKCKSERRKWFKIPEPSFYWKSRFRVIRIHDRRECGAFVRAFERWGEERFEWATFMFKPGTTIAI